VPVVDVHTLLQLAVDKEDELAAVGVPLVQVDRHLQEHFAASPMIRDGNFGPEPGIAVQAAPAVIRTERLPCSQVGLFRFSIKSHLAVQRRHRLVVAIDQVMQVFADPLDLLQLKIHVDPPFFSAPTDRPDPRLEIWPGDGWKNSCWLISP